MSGPDPRAWFEAKVKAVTEEGKRALREAMQAGEEITKHNIETRGTAKSGKRGRIETGEMLSEVQSQTSVSANEAIGRFGWIDRTPDYVRYQEPGTGLIEPMWALRDAGEEVLVDYLQDMERVFRSS